MMYKAKTYCTWTLKSNFYYHKQIEVYADQKPRGRKSKDIIRIIVLNEPHAIEKFLPWLEKHKDRYDYVFTYYEPLLQENKKAVKFLGIQPWVRDYKFPEKEFSVSTLVSGKLFPGLEGHTMRHKLWQDRAKVKIPKKFFLSSFDLYGDADYNGKRILYKKKDPLFDSMFHIAIENTRMKNMFTEKIIDCFQTKTVPIYYGDPDIGFHFDTHGILKANSVDEIVDICNKLTPIAYSDMQYAVEANYKLSMKYLDFNKNLDKTIEKTLSNDVQ